MLSNAHSAALYLFLLEDTVASAPMCAHGWDKTLIVDGEAFKGCGGTIPILHWSEQRRFPL